MRRQLVKGSNFEKCNHFWSIPTNVLAPFVFSRLKPTDVQFKAEKIILKIDIFTKPLRPPFLNEEFFRVPLQRVAVPIS